MLRVLTISTLFPNVVRPAFGVFVENQTRALASLKGVEVRVINPIGLPPTPFDLHPHYRDLRDLPAQEDWRGLRVARPPMLTIPGLSGRFNPALMARAVRPVIEGWRQEGFAFDVIDAQFFYPDGPAAACLAAELGVPLLVKARGADIHYWGRQQGCREQIMSAAAQAGCLLAVSQSLARDMAELGMDASKISVHYTGCDLDLFRPRDRTTAKVRLRVPGTLIVSLGSLIPRKGHDLVVQAMTELEGATLLLVGEGSERTRLQKMIQRLGLTDRVRLIGNLPHAALAEVLAAADVMALASESEGLANAWIEAMACGTPVVTPAVDGAVEAIDRPAAGRLLRERSPSAIAAAIRSILDDPPTPAAVRESAERFSWERNGRQLYEHLVRLAATRPVQ